MSAQGFTSEWLDLRAAADARALERSGATRALLQADVRAVPPPIDADLHVVDLGAGSGNALVRLAPEFAAQGFTSQCWTLVDSDEALLRLAVARADALGVRASKHVTGLDPPPTELLHGADIVSASALLDLASREWVSALAEALAAACVPRVLLSLSVDHRLEWTPHDPDDTLVTRAYLADMRRDKGLGGRALGPAAPAAARRALARVGYTTHALDSAWRLGPMDAALQTEKLNQVAAVTGAHAWAARRRASLDAGLGDLVVGHIDLVALRPAGGAARVGAPVSRDAAADPRDAPCRSPASSRSPCP